jgi:hypothetical protein
LDCLHILHVVLDQHRTWPCIFQPSGEPTPTLDSPILFQRLLACRLYPRGQSQSHSATRRKENVIRKKDEKKERKTLTHLAPPSKTSCYENRTPVLPNNPRKATALLRRLTSIEAKHHHQRSPSRKREVRQRTRRKESLRTEIREHTHAHTQTRSLVARTHRIRCINRQSGAHPPNQTKNTSHPAPPPRSIPARGASLCATPQ